MKFFLTLAVVTFAGCETAAPDQIQIELQTHQQMEEKVNDVIMQLRVDCDSSLLQVARMKVDSIRNSSKSIKLKFRKKV